METPHPRVRDLRVTPSGVCTFTLEGGSDGLANALRRTMLQDLPAWAVSRVNFLRNDTPFPDEMLAHRLGLIPLMPVAAAPEAGAPETACFRLERTGPCTVLSADLMPSGPVRADQSISLCPLSEGQSLILEAECKVGTGAQHARFVQVVAPSYAVRHAGVTGPECFCPGPGPTERCAQCGATKPSAELLAQPRVHLFRFETTGRDPRDLLTQTVLTLRAKVAGLRAALESPTADG